MTALTFARYAWPRAGSRERALLEWEFAHSPLEAEDAVPSIDAAQRVMWHPVQDPGSMVQWECYLAGLAGPAGTASPGHPYAGTASQEYLWTADVIWWFRTEIRADALDPDAVRAELVFDGVDHDAWVWVDGSPAGEHHGMFGGPVLDVSEWLPRAGAPASRHEVVVALRPAGAGRGKEIGWGTKGRLVKPETFCRWVNNPDFVTTGIWRPVRLVQTGAHRLERPRVHTRLAGDGSVRVIVEVEVLRSDVQADLHWVVRHGGVPPVWDRRLVRPADDPTIGRSDGAERTPAQLTVSATLRDGADEIVAAADTDLDVSPGRVWARLELKVDDPQLWWPEGTAPEGAGPVLHTLSIDLDGRDHLEVPIGLREIEWQPADGPRLADHWFDWQARVNGTAVALRGMNWMPSDILRQDVERIRHLLTLMRDAGVQIVRVWGGGLLETDEFYDACDELGLMVWQDFPINTLYDCSDIPLDVWEQQVTWTVERLRNRASLAVWCGGNEFEPYAPENAAVMGIAERTIADLDGTRRFIRSCSDPGDVHPYLDCDSTWYLPMYRDVPAISEWGGHTLPTLASLAEIVPADELERPLDALLSPDPEAFQASHPALHHHWAEFQPDRVPRMLHRARIYDDLAQASFTQGVEAIQLGAAEILQTVITDFSADDTAVRMLMPWVYNRPWPSVGMQAVDHSGRPTPGYYAIKRGYRPSSIVIRLEEEALAPGEPLRFSVGLTRGEGAVARHGRAVRVTVYDQSLRERAGHVVHLGPGADGFRALAVDPHGSDVDDVRAFIVVAVAADDPQTQHVRVIRVSPSLTDPSVRAAYRSAPNPTAHFMVGSLREAVAASPATVRWSATASMEDSIMLTLENTGDVPAAFVTIDSADPLWMTLPEDSGFWIEPGTVRRVTVPVRPTAEVSALVTERPEAGSTPADAIRVRGWNL